jgi:hypothetical protein
MLSAQYNAAPEFHLQQHGLHGNNCPKTKVSLNVQKRVKGLEFKLRAGRERAVLDQFPSSSSTSIPGKPSS